MPRLKRNARRFDECIEYGGAMPELHYEPSAVGRPVVVESADGRTRVTVAMTGAYVPVPASFAHLGVLTFVVVPIWVAGVVLVRFCLRRPNAPRAVFDVDRDRFGLTMCGRTSWEATTFDWPRAAVVEARANRYERGLWIDVPGHMKETILRDVPRDTIERVEAALREALAEAKLTGGGRVDSSEP